MSIAQRKDGRYLVKYKVDETWKQKSFRTIAEAEQFEADLKSDNATSDRMTVGELMAAFFRNNKRHPRTVYKVVACLCGWNNKMTGTLTCGEGRFLFDRYVDSLGRKDLEALREAYRARGLKNSSINIITSHIRGIFSWGVEQDLIPSNPWKEYKNLKKEPRKINVSLDTYKTIYAAAPPWLQWAMKTAFCLCLRFGVVELWRLKWDSFNFTNGTVTLAQGKSGILKTVIPPKPYIEEAKQRYEDDKQRGYELVCRSRHNKPITQYWCFWKATCNRAGVYMRPYDIRHLAATTMLANGADLASVAAQLGHQGCDITGRIYAHVTAAGQRIASNALAIY